MNGPVRFPYLQPDLSAHGIGIDLLIIFTHIFMGVLFVVWGVYFVYALWKFRSRAGHKATYSPIKAVASKYIEIGVIVIEVILLFGLSLPIWAEYKTIPQAGKGDAENAMTIRVMAQQFQWNVHYPGRDGVFGKTSPDLIDEATNPLGLDENDDASHDDIFSPNVFNVPVDVPVIVELTSRDVIHSFALPRLRVKQDAVPGMRIPIHFTGKIVGDGEIACAQLCGNGHSKMVGKMAVLSQADYDKWISEQSVFIDDGDEEEFEGGGEGAAPASVQTAPPAAEAAPAPAPAEQPAAAAPADAAPARDFGDDGFDN